MNDEQLLRYSRQIMLSGFDIEGQQKLLASRVLIIGLGGLGSPAALYLAAAGVGELWLADYDAVELSNLQRQISHRMKDIGRQKVISAGEAIAALNPDIRTVPLSEKVTGQLLLDTVAKVDLVIDASDNFATRFEVNRACVKLKTPLISGAAIRSEGQLTVFDLRDENSPCYHCLYQDGADDEQPSCSESGVIAPLVGVIGSMQALEATKLLSGFGQPMTGWLMIFDAYLMEWRKLKLGKRTDCAVCQPGSLG